MESKVLKIALLTGCNDKHYQIGLLSGLVANPVKVDFIANDDMIEAAGYSQVKYFNVRGDQDPRAPITDKIFRVLKYYGALLKYAFQSDARIFHIQWLNKFQYLDRTLLNIYYKGLGKKLVFTAHNINAGRRDGNDSWLNRLTLRWMYRLMDHIIVHTEQMKSEIIKDFIVPEEKVTVIPHGIHDAIPCSALAKTQARERLGLAADEKVILFFGNIRPYKGLDYLVKAMAMLPGDFSKIKLIIAGQIEEPGYWDKILKLMEEDGLRDRIMTNVGFVPDNEIEVFVKAADLMVLPYTEVFQSGILFLSYNFGLPVVATDVGSLREEVLEGETGFICRPLDPVDLAEKIERYFCSGLFHNLEAKREKIKEYAREKYSWQIIGEKTFRVYQGLI
jgi:D-inositol-3-phosphate glycosyltransferase